YLFVSIIDRWRVIERTPGVLRLIKFGDAPAKCPNSEIAKLLNQRAATGLVRLPKKPKASTRAKPFEIGARVRIVSGSFCGFDAIYAGATTREREIAPLDLLGRAQVPVELDADQLAESSEFASASHLR